MPIICCRELEQSTQLSKWTKSFRMSFHKLSDDELKLKLVELVDLIKSNENMPQNVGKFC